MEKNGIAHSNMLCVMYIFHDGSNRLPILSLPTASNSHLDYHNIVTASSSGL